MTPTQLIGRLISSGVCPERIKRILGLPRGVRVLYGIAKQRRLI